MSSRHSKISTRTPNGTSGSSNYKSSRRSRTQQQEPLDDQLTDWWSATVLGDNPCVSDDGSQCSLGWEYTKEKISMTSSSNIDGNPCASDEHGSQSSSSGWEFTMEELSMTSAAGGNNACVSDDGSTAASQSSHGWEFNMEELSMSSATGGDNPCVSDDSRFSLLSEFTMEEFRTTSADDNNSCTKDVVWKTSRNGHSFSTQPLRAIK